MRFTSTYGSPLGAILLASDGEALVGLWFEGQKHYAARLTEDHETRDLPVFRQTAGWLDDYFAGRDPGPTPPVNPLGTPFQIAVWSVLATIPRGSTCTYGDIARKLEERRGGARTSARAVGGAVGRNPISIIIPCHRVIGADGSLTGYAGGIERKTALLKLEGARS